MSPGNEYRKRLRSYRTPLIIRRSPRFLPQNANNEASSSTATKNQPNFSEKFLSQKTHLQSPPILALPTQISSFKKPQLQSPAISATPTQISSFKNKKEGCSTKCPREPLRPVDNLQGSANPSQGKPLRRSLRLALISLSDNGKELLAPVTERRLSARLMGSVGVLEEKENMGIDGLSDEQGSENLGVREKIEEKIDGSKDNVENDKVDREIREKDEEEKEKKRKMEKRDEKIGSKKVDEGKSCGCGDWTNEQDAALQRAYLVAKPSPHFWKKVAKLVLFLSLLFLCIITMTISLLVSYIVF